MKPTVVPVATLNAIVNFAHHRLPETRAWHLLRHPFDPQALGDVLHAQNLASVCAVRGVPVPDDAPYRWLNCPHTVSPVAFLKLVEEVEDQSDGALDWPETMAHRVVEALRRDAIRLLTGYARMPRRLEVDLANPAVAHLMAVGR